LQVRKISSDTKKHKSRRFDGLFDTRYFADMTIADTSEALSISTATVERHWAFAHAWLKRELSDK